jgi:hypothetical protein
MEQDHREQDQWAEKDQGAVRAEAKAGCVVVDLARVESVSALSVIPECHMSSVFLARSKNAHNADL